MHVRVSDLVVDLYQNPHRLETLEALRRELDAPRHARELADFLRWWAPYAPDDALASSVLLDAARRSVSAGQAPLVVLATLIAALERDPSNEQAASEIRAHLESTHDFCELEQVFSEWALSTRREGCSPVVCALASFTLAHLRIRYRNDPDGAIDALRDALHAFPEYPHAKRALAALYTRRARSRVAHDEKGEREDRHRAAELLYELGRDDVSEDAVSYLQRALDLVPNHSAALERLLVRLGDDELSARRLRVLAYVESAPDRVQSHCHRFELVRCLLHERRFAEAVPHLRFLSSRGYTEAEAILARLCPDAARPAEAPIPRRPPPPAFQTQSPKRHGAGHPSPSDAESPRSTPDAGPTDGVETSVRRVGTSALERAADNDAGAARRRKRGALRLVELGHTLGLTVFAISALSAFTSL